MPEGLKKTFPVHVNFDLALLRVHRIDGMILSIGWKDQSHRHGQSNRSKASHHVTSEQLSRAWPESYRHLELAAARGATPPLGRPGPRVQRDFAAKRLESYGEPASSRASCRKSRPYLARLRPLGKQSQSARAQYESRPEGYAPRQGNREGRLLSASRDYTPFKATHAFPSRSILWAPDYNFSQSRYKTFTYAVNDEPWLPPPRFGTAPPHRWHILLPTKSPWRRPSTRFAPASGCVMRCLTPNLAKSSIHRTR